jgi:hypothetical protein
MKDALLFPLLFSRYVSTSRYLWLLPGPSSYPDEMYLSIRTDSTNFATSKWSMLLPRAVYFLVYTCAQTRMPAFASFFGLLSSLNFFKFLRNFHFRLFPPSKYSIFSFRSWCIPKFGSINRNEQRKWQTASSNRKVKSPRLKSWIRVDSGKLSSDREMRFVFVSLLRIDNAAHTSFASFWILSRIICVQINISGILKVSLK